jgi:hypothetical protein
MDTFRALKAFIRNHVVLFLLGVATVVLYVYRLGSLPTPQLAADEVLTLQASSTLHDLVSNPFFLPLNAARWLTTTLLPGHLNSAARFPSVVMALITIATLVYIIRRWYRERTMYMGFFLVATSAWILHIGRLATNDVPYLAAVPLLIATHLLLFDYVERKIVIFLCAGVFAVLLYVPGLVWLVLASIIWQRNEIKESLRQLSAPLAALLVGLFLIALAPLVYGMAQHTSIDYLVTWLGLPTTIPTWKEPLKNLAAAIAFIGVRAPIDPVRWLGRLPLLDAFTAISFVAGIAFYFKHIGAERTKLLLLYGTLGLLLCAGGGTVTRSIIVPVVYLVAVGGIAFILHQWLHVFPRNPLARRFGIAMICLAIALSCLYNFRHYFVAWPHNDDTVRTFSLK